MTKEDAQNCFREFAKFGCVQSTKHCKERMRERNITIDDVLHVLLWGQVTQIEYDSIHDSWKCKVKGLDIDGEELIFIASIYENCQTVRCITVF